MNLEIKNLSKTYKGKVRKIWEEITLIIHLVM